MLENSFVLRQKLRSFKSDLSYEDDISHFDKRDSDYELEPVKGGKNYHKLRPFTINEKSCNLADRRLTSIRQQSDQLLSAFGDKIAASPTAVYRKRERFRMKALESCDDSLKKANAMQLCYDGKIINKMDRYVFLTQVIADHSSTGEHVVAVKSYSEGKFVTSEAVFNAMVEVYRPYFNSIYSIMAVATALNSGKKSGINKRMFDYFNANVGHDIHTLECLFHVNEIYFTHVIAGG